MIMDFIFKLWRRLSSTIQWSLLWLFNNKFMVSVAGLVYDEENRILLLRHRHWIPDVWGLPGGIVERGETLEDAFSREVFEETGLSVSHIEMIDFFSGFNLRMEGYFRSRLAKPYDESSINIQTQEILEARFFSFEEMPSNILKTHHKLIINENQKL
jgi:ADP-ribose pyrophosphatase YjhB (NUDIX family)